jgi:hypothetical protein
VAETEDRNAGSGGHVVLFYSHDDELAWLVSEYLLDALRAGGAAIMIATGAHRHVIERRLTEAGLDLAAARAAGAYLALDAHETLRRFVVGDWPNPATFWQVVSPLVRHSGGKPIHLFGEAVAVLWDEGLVNAAIEVEAMWNELGGQYPFSLLCGYPARFAGEDQHRDALTEVCRTHDTVLGDPDPATPAPGRTRRPRLDGPASPGYFG